MKFSTCALIAISSAFIVLVNYSCKKELTGTQGSSQKPLTNVTTTAATNITGTSALVGGILTVNVDTAITDKGICFSTSPNPTIAAFKISAGRGIDSFVCALDTLAPQTTYYVRAYATDSNGTSYGNQVTFKTATIDPPLSVYMTDGNQTIYAFNAANGATKWSVSLSFPSTLAPRNLSSPVFASNTIFVASISNQLMAYDTAGKLKWSAPLSGQWTNDDPVINNGVLYLENVKLQGSTSQAGLTAYSINTGQIIWQYYDSIAQPSNAVVGYTFDASNIYIVTAYNIVSISQQTGSLNWSVKGYPENESPPLIVNNTLYCIEFGYPGLVAFDKTTGNQLWGNADFEYEWVQYSGQLEGGPSYYKYGNLYCQLGQIVNVVDPANGNVKLTIEPSPTDQYTVSIISNNNVYMLSDAHLTVSNAINGALLQTIDINPIGGGLTVVNGLVYFAKDYQYIPPTLQANVLYCLNPISGRPVWTTAALNYLSLSTTPCVVTKSGQYYLNSANE